MQTVTNNTLSVSAKDTSSHDLIMKQVRTACMQSFQGSSHACTLYTTITQLVKALELQSVT